MKFLCPNCKAKYQISDEKISGRTLKMDCRRCNHPIVIRGDQQQRRSARPSGASNSVQPRRSGSHVGPSPSRSSRGALGADFRKQSVPAQSSRPTALDQWHVAINDVPVGPMKRDEVLKKIQAGAIKPDSLSWREGFDDWRPLKDIPELAALLRKKAPPPKSPGFPSPARGLPSSRPSSPRGQRGASARPPRRPQAAAPSARPDAARPAARGNVVPIGGRLGAAAAPALEELGDFLEDDEPTRVGTAIDFEAVEREAKIQRDRDSGAALAPVAPTVDPFAAPAPSPKSSPPSAPPAAAPLPSPAASSAPPAAAGASDPGPLPVGAPIDPFAPGTADAVPIASAPPAVSEAPPRRRRGIPIGAWIAIAGAMAFGVALAVIVGQHMLNQPPEVAVAPPTPPVPETSEGPVEAQPDINLVAEGEGEGEGEPGEGEGATSEGATSEGEGEGESAGSEGAAANTNPNRSGSGGGSRSGRTGASTTSDSTTGTGGRGRTEPSGPVSDSLRRAMEEAGGSNTGPATVRPRPGVLDDDDRPRGGGLNGDQIRAVVAREGSGVRRCYETAARASGQAPRVRLDVNVTIGTSGTVQSARVEGSGFGSLNECVRRTIIRWRFPRAGEQTQTRIPFVFAGQED